MNRKQKWVIFFDVLVVLFVSLPAAGFAAGAMTQTAALIGLVLVVLATVGLQLWVVSYCRTRPQPNWPTSPRPTRPPAGY